MPQHKLIAKKSNKQKISRKKVVNLTKGKKFIKAKKTKAIKAEQDNKLIIKSINKKIRGSLKDIAKVVDKKNVTV